MVTKDKSLKDKAMKIKGKDYVLVADRVRYFSEEYPKGSITTELISDPTSEYIIIKATVRPADVDNNFRTFTGYSQAVIGDGMVNKTAALENAETSAVGRALGFMGIGVIESIASADEMAKTKINGIPVATPKQVEWVRSVAAEVSGAEQVDDIDAWVKKNLTLSPTQIPISKVKDAIDKIKEIGQALDKQEAEELDEVAEVTEEDLKALDNGELPY
jgi:hypothetical protein